MKITPASRSLVMVYWLVLSGYAYGLGLGLRLVTPFLDALIFMLLVVGSIIMVPIFMLLGVVLYVFPGASPTIWRDIRIPFGCFWFGVVMQVWFLPDANFYEDYTHPMVAPLSAIFRVSPTVCHYVLAIVFFGLCAISYGRILIVGRRAPRVDAPAAPDYRVGPTWWWVGLSIVIPIATVCISPMHQLSRVVFWEIGILLPLGLGFLLAPAHKSVLSRIKMPLACFWAVIVVANLAWPQPWGVTVCAAMAVACWIWVICRGRWGHAARRGPVSLLRCRCWTSRRRKAPGRQR